jgi:CRISPR/Cas system-associated exonuclease Cas4 (RecB family)
MTDHISASQINLYIQCSLKYKFQYVDRIPRPFKSSGLAFGSVMHSALDFFHKQKIKGNGITLDKLLKIFEVDWFRQKVENEIRYKDGETEAELLLQGKQILSKYFHSYDGRPVASETPFSLPLIEPVTGEILGPTINGIIDLIEFEHVIVEFKATARTMDEQSVEDSVQLTCYAYAYRMLFQKEPKTLKLLNFVKTKNPKIVPLETKRDTRDFKRLFHLAQEVLRGIYSGVFIPESNFMCKDCEYGEPCREWGGNGKS